ncbi:hypothetical protein [Paraburkholderia fungorum]|uniref:hypothetical protein n=1 Tax=Paraburkholderia fungorum TaxID=134537 RepID=UPI0028773588|nr:hypothetical protein [Paraburkholderia fungorum]
MNANQLHKWVRLREQSNAPVREDMAVASSAFFPVIAIDDAAGAGFITRCAARISPGANAFVAAIRDAGTAVG